MKKSTILIILVIFSLISIHSCKKEKKTNEIEEEFEEQIYSKILIENQDYDFGDTVLKSV